MKKLLFVFSTILLFLISCDRYDTDLYSNNSIEMMFTNFSSALQQASADSLEEVASFYSEDYWNVNEQAQSTDYEGALSFYRDFYSTYQDSFYLEAQLDEYFQDLSVKWTLFKVNRQTAEKSVLSVINDFLINDNGTYKLYGNQVSPPPEFDPTKPMIFIQYFTATWCGNCPDAAEKIDELRKQYGGQLLYIEFIQDNNITSPSFFEYWNSYGLIEMPTSVFQGQTILGNSQEQTLIQYSETVENIYNNQDLVLSFGDITYEAYETEVSGQVNINIPDGFDTSNLVLHSVIIDKHPGLHYHTDNSEMHNAVIGSSSISVSANPVNFSIDSNKELEDDCELVFWIQNSNNNLIYNATQIDIQ